MNLGKQLSIMAGDKAESGASLKVDTQASRFLHKTKTINSDTASDKLPISKETAALVVNGLAKLKSKGQENNKLKQAQRKSISPMKDGSVHPDVASPNGPSPWKVSNFAFPENPGFLERIDDHNEDQAKAKQALTLIKKERKRQNKDQSNPRVDFIPFLNSQISHLSNQRAALIDDHRPGPNSRAELKVTSNFKIDDPNSVLHIANYQQNKEFFEFAKVSANLEGRKVLKINAPDCQTFFRVHHEISEINRKREEFLAMKKKFFDQKDPNEIVEYDQTIKATGAIQNPEEFKKKIKSSKEYQKGEKLAKKFTSKIDKQLKSKIDEAQITNFLSSVQSPKMPRKSLITIEDD